VSSGIGKKYSKAINKIVFYFDEGRRNWMVNGGKQNLNTISLGSVVNLAFGLKL